MSELRNEKNYQTSPRRTLDLSTTAPLPTQDDVSIIIRVLYNCTVKINLLDLLEIRSPLEAQDNDCQHGMSIALRLGQFSFFSCINSNSCYETWASNGHCRQVLQNVNLPPSTLKSHLFLYPVL